MKLLGDSSFVVKLAAGFLLFLLVIVVFGPVISPPDPTQGSLRTAMQGPSGEFWLGTDYLGRDVLSRLIAGARVAMFAGLEAVVVALALGLPVGLTIGFLGGWPDRIGMRIIEGVSAIPGLVLAIGIIAAFGSGLTRSMFAVGVAFAMGVARLARGLVLAERERLYVDGARVIGAGRGGLLLRHITPNVAAPLIVLATMIFASAVTIEAGLSYLGLGVEPPTASWGAMLAAAQRTYREQPLQTLPPGAAILLTVLAINIVGDSLLRRRKGESFDHPAGYLEPVVIAPRGGPPAAGVSDIADDGSLLSVRGLTVRYGDGVPAVAGVDLDIAPGEFVALVGESGSGKTSVAMAVAGLLTPPAAVVADTVSLRTGEGERLELAGSDLRRQRGWRREVGVVFQEPAASLNPLQTVGRQLRDVLEVAGHDSGRAEARSIELLTDVGIPRPGDVLRLRPHQISGGMAQRVVIAMALAKEPKLLIADEPTTALDVMVQAEIISLLRELGRSHGVAVLLVTHDLGVAAHLADRALVMFRGHVVESATISELVRSPRHPYTSELVRAVPRNVPGRRVEPTVDAVVDSVIGTDALERGCPYRGRCPFASDECADEVALVSDGRRAVACVHAVELVTAGALEGAL